MKLNVPALPFCGGCPCEAVRFVVKEMPLLVYACHCRECQRWSGSAFSMSMPIRAGAFAITCGEPKHWRRTGASGAESTSWFCGECGGRVYGQRSGRPDIISVRAGTLDDTSWVRPVLISTLAVHKPGSESRTMPSALTSCPAFSRGS